MSNIPKINLRNSVTEYSQSIRKENTGKIQNYGILDCKASIAAGKIKYLMPPLGALLSLSDGLVGVRLACQAVIRCPNQDQ